MPEQKLLPHNEVNVSVLFITYNRSDLLEIAFQSIRQRMDFGSLGVEFIVSDDGSDVAHLARIRSLPFHKHMLSKKNEGLGRNCNKGLAAVAGRYILQIQDDCEFVGDKRLLSMALEILRADEDVGIVQLTHQTPDVPHEVRYLKDGTRYVVFNNDGIPQKRDCGARPYSDQPHLKRKEFCEDIGRYKEGVPMTDMESDYQQRVACQKRWRVASIGQASGFKHLGAARSYNPCVLRARRLERIECYPLVGSVLKRARPTLRRIRDWIWDSGL